MKTYFTLLFFFACCSCEKKRDQIQPSDLESQVDEWQSKKPSPVFEIVIAKETITLPEQTLYERVKLINSYFRSDELSNKGVSVVIDKGVDADGIVCPPVTLKHPTLGQVIKYTCCNFKICGRASNLTVEIYYCGS